MVGSDPFQKVTRKDYLPLHLSNLMHLEQPYLARLHLNSTPEKLDKLH